MKRTQISRKRTTKQANRQRKVGDALRLYFNLHELPTGQEYAACQACGEPVHFSQLTPAHKVRRWKGCLTDNPENIMALDWACHQRVDMGGEDDVRKAFENSPANVINGDLINWPKGVFL